MLTTAFGLAMLANFTLTLLMGRMLDSSEFGTLGLLVAIFLFCSMPASAIGVMTVTRTAPWASTGDIGKIASFRSAFGKRTALIGTLLVAISAISAPLLDDSFKLSSPTPVVLVAGAIGFWLALTVNRGILQGMRLFTPLALSFVVEAFSRVALAVTFVWLWRSATAAAAGILASAAFCWLLTLPVLRKNIGPVPSNVPGLSIPRIGEAGTVIVSLAAIAWMQNADVFAVKASVPPWESGQYVATSTLGKAFFFFTLAAVTTMLPEASESRGLHGRLRIAGRASAMILLMAIPVVILAFAMPDLIVSTVYGESRAELASWLGLIVVSSILLSLVHLGANYLAALGRSLYMPILVTTGVGELFALLTLGGKSIARIVAIVISANFIAVAGLAIDAARESGLKRSHQVTATPGGA